MKASFILTLLMVISVDIVWGQTKLIEFHQADQIELQKPDNDGVYQLNIKPEPFTITFPGELINVCTDLNADLFEFTKPDTDINADFNSCFFIFKSKAMDKEADYLILGTDGSSPLNEAHGARKTDSEHSVFKVSSLSVDSEKLPVSGFSEFYMALWLDSNKDQYVDEAELLKVKVNVEQ